MPHTSVDQTHGDVELCKIQLAAIVRISQCPKMRVKDRAYPQLTAHAPNLRQIILVQTTLAEDLQSRLTADEPLATSIPSAEDLVIALLLRFGERPGHLGRSTAALLLVVLQVVHAAVGFLWIDW